VLDVIIGFGAGDIDKSLYETFCENLCDNVRANSRVIE
jgi:hypothetical protein